MEIIKLYVAWKALLYQILLINIAGKYQFKQRTQRKGNRAAWSVMELGAEPRIAKYVNYVFQWTKYLTDIFQLSTYLCP